MKRIFKMTLGLFSVLLLTQCQKDDMTSAVQQNNGFITKKLNHEDLAKNSSVINKLNKLREGQQKNAERSSTAREIYNADYDFIFLTNNVNFVEDTRTGKHSYNFRVIRNETSSTTNLENLVLKSNTTGGYDAYLVEYGFTYEQLKNQDEIIATSNSVLFTPIDFDTKDLEDEGIVSRIIPPKYECITVGYWAPGIAHNGELHGAHCTCTPYSTFVTITETCGFFGGGNTGEPTTGGSLGGNSGGGGGHGGSSSSNGGSDGTDADGLPLFPSTGDGADADKCKTSKEDLKDMFPNASDANMEKLADVLNEKAKDFGIDTKEKLRHFLAQTGHETGGFTTLNVTESTYWTTASLLAGTFSSKFTMNQTLANANPNLYYAPDYLRNSEAVANITMCCRYDNGDFASGDGYRYRGRGIIQLSFKTNYEGFKTWYNNKYDPDIDPVTNPDIIASDEDLAIMSGLWYFKHKVLDKLTVDGDTTVKKVTKKVNGGTNGLDDRKTRFASAKTKIKCK